MVKRKFVAPLIALLLCVSMIGVGFAGWVISTTTSDDANGTFSVYTVSNRFISFVATEPQPVSFGHPESMSISSPWLTFEDTTENTKENTKISIPLIFKDGNSNLSSLENYKNCTLSFAITFDVTDSNALGATTYASLKNSNYITGPDDNATVTLTAKVDGNGVLTVDTASGTNTEYFLLQKVTTPSNGNYLNLKINFGWGTKFGIDSQSKSTDTNPYTYYNTGKTANGFVEGTSGTTWAQDAATTLDALAKLGSSYSVTIVASVAKTPAQQ